VLFLGPVRGTISNDALAWTRDGILYSDGRNLRAAKAGESRVVMRRVRAVRVSGDGEHIDTHRNQRQLVPGEDVAAAHEVEDRRRR
jgi:hypothetical protein